MLLFCSYLVILFVCFAFICFLARVSIVVVHCRAADNLLVANVMSPLLQRPAGSHLARLVLMLAAGLVWMRQTQG